MATGKRIGTAIVRKTKDGRELIVAKIDEITFDKNKEYRIVISKEKLERKGNADVYLHVEEKPEKLQTVEIKNEKEKLDELLSKISELNEKISLLEKRIENLEKYVE